MKAKYVTYTSSLPSVVMEELIEYASKNNKKKNEIIAEALADYLKEKRKMEYAESFKKIKNDPEQKELAEAGLGDFVKWIEEYENS
ncbi:MAG TPA: hypothetical protein VLJ41_16645 [Segetibacter sp.]|nr:hypothetical protein [Segetibacter sp.]